MVRLLQSWAASITLERKKQSVGFFFLATVYDFKESGWAKRFVIRKIPSEEKYRKLCSYLERTVHL